MIKQRFNAGQPADLYFWRDSAGHEIDVVYETAAGLQAVEIKSAAPLRRTGRMGCRSGRNLPATRQRDSRS
jgi:hypothetical protein